MLYLILNHKTQIAKLKSSFQPQSIVYIDNFKMDTDDLGTTIFNDNISIWWPNNGIVIHQYK
jgi:hypothetical protein